MAPPTSTDPTDRAAAVGSVVPEPLSARNPRVADLARLSRQRRTREQEGRFVLDGPVLLGAALDDGVEVHDVFVDPDAAARADVAEAVAAAVGRGARAWAVQGGLRGHVEPRTPNGLAAVARTPDRVPPSGAGGTPLHLVLVGVGDPGNVGTLLRTAEAVGATSVLLTDGSVDPWSPKVVRASAGSVLRVPVDHGPAAQVLAEMGRAGVRRVATAGEGGAAPQELDLAGPVALVLGSEAHGLPDDLEGGVDARATLPMAGRVESLNVAVAGSVLAYEVLRQRAAALRP